MGQLEIKANILSPYCINLVFFCGTYALHLCISCKYCPSKGRQPLDSAVGLKVWESSLGRPDQWWCDSLLFFFTSQVSVGTWGCSRKGMVCLRCVCSLLRTKLPSLQVFQKRSPDKCLLFIHISCPNNFLFSSFPTLPHTSEQHERKQAVNIGIFYQIFSFFLFQMCQLWEPTLSSNLMFCQDLRSKFFSEKLVGVNASGSSSRRQV